jgi:hypothetical protein
MKTWIRCALALVSCFLFLQACGLVGGPEATVRNFYKALEKGELDKAVDKLSAQALALGRDKLKAGLAEVTQETKEKGGIKSLDFQNTEITGDVATLKLVIQFGNDTSETQNVKLVKEDGRWKIQPSK